MKAFRMEFSTSPFCLLASLLETNMDAKSVESHHLSIEDMCRAALSEIERQALQSRVARIVDVRFTHNQLLRLKESTRP